MKQFVFILAFLFTLGTTSNAFSQTTKKQKTYKKHRAKKKSVKKVYRLNSDNSNSRKIHIGPRGGKYYINSNGNKTYIK